MFYQNDSPMRNTAEVTNGKSSAVLSQSISDLFGPLVEFNDIYGKKGEVLFNSSVPDTTQNINGCL
jgi:hypothetical protein